MTSKLTIEQAKRLRNDFECWQQDYDPKDDKEQYDMFGRGMAAMDMLIAGMYQEPVAYTDERNLGYIDRGRETAYLCGKQNSEGGDIPLYRHAQPAPASEPMAVTDDELNAALQIHRLKVDGHSQLSDAFRAGFKYARRTVPPEKVSVPDFGGLTKCIVQRLVDYGAADDDSIASAEEFVYNACRAAMLQGADGKPELTVWYGAMPETNGKTNWTAILHREGQRLWEGITIDRSEYPDRVRYEADRMRHLIGELADEPDILAYDAEAHSGYVYPSNSPVIPEGYVMVPKELTPEMRDAWDSAPNSSTDDDVNMCNAYRAMLAAATQLPGSEPATVPGKWIPVSERMPEERETVVLVADERGIVWCAEIQDGEIYPDEFPGTRGFGCAEATHWMPLPAAPQEVNHG